MSKRNYWPCSKLVGIYGESFQLKLRR
jgi:hypothetical protein